MDKKKTRAAGKGMFLRGRGERIPKKRASTKKWLALPGDRIKNSGLDMKKRTLEQGWGVRWERGW